MCADDIRPEIPVFPMTSSLQSFLRLHHLLLELLSLMLQLLPVPFKLEVFTNGNSHNNRQLSGHLGLQH